LSLTSTNVIYHTIVVAPTPASSVTAAYTQSLNLPAVSVVTAPVYGGYDSSTAVYPTGTAAPSASYTSPETPYFTGAAVRSRSMGVAGLVGAMAVGLFAI
jgi:hypothetical protein